MTKDEEAMALRIPREYLGNRADLLSSSEWKQIASRLRDEWTKGQEQQEPVGCMAYSKDAIIWKDLPVGTKLYAAPVQQEITDDPAKCPTCGYSFYERASPVPQAGMVMVPREPTIKKLEQFIGHGLYCGDRPYQDLIDNARKKYAEVINLLDASPNAAPQGETASTLGTPAVAAPFFQVQTALVELRQAVTNLERKVDDYLENLK